MKNFVGEENKKRICKGGNVFLKEKNIYKLGKELGLKNDEINQILEKTNKITEQPIISMGPFKYPGTHYGTISIKDF